MKAATISRSTAEDSITLRGEKVTSRKRSSEAKLEWGGVGFPLPRSLTVEPMFRKVACIFIDRLRSMRRTDSSMNLHHYQSERLWQGECLRGLTVPLVDQTNQIAQIKPRLDAAVRQRKKNDIMTICR